MWSGLGSRGVPTQHWVSGALLSNFDSTASFGSDQQLTLGILLMEEMYHSWGLLQQWKSMRVTEVVSGPIKKEIMKALCHDYWVDIDQGD